MIRISLNINIEKPKWWYKIFPCQHEIVSVEENFLSRYGTHTSYSYCLKCGRKSMHIERNCKHKENCFGYCEYCFKRLNKFNCQHEWVKEPDTDDFYCENCGIWKDTGNIF